MDEHVARAPRRVSRILLVEDEPAMADTVAYALRADGYEVELAEDGERALEAVSDRAFDALVLDLMLPGVSGIEVCRRVRAESPVPILMVTARDGVADRVAGLDAGADDYISKPFAMNELLARVRAVLRRRELDAGEARLVRNVGGLHLDLERYEATADDQPVQLTPSELKLLVFLAREPGRVFSRHEILQHLWGSDYVGDARAADLHISNIRRKIERDPESPERLVTVRGEGYKLVAV